MKKIETVVAFLALTSASVVWAAQDGVANNLSVYEGKSIFSSSLKDEVVGVSPQAGVIGFADSGRSYHSKAVEGVIADINLIPLLAPELNDYFLGVSTGGFYSHLGSNSSNFFGSNTDDTSGSNLAIIPIDLKVGYHLSDRIRVSVHGGGNLTYRSTASAANFGDSSVGSNSNWTLFPNAGADLEVGITKEISLAARPDVTFTTGQEAYMGTLGLIIPMSF